MAHPAVDELAGVGHLRTGLGALLHALFQVVEGEGAMARLLSTSRTAAGERRAARPSVGSRLRAPSLAPLEWRHDRACPRFLVRLRLDLFLSGGDAHRTLASAAGVEVKFRPFLLGPIFKAQGWTTSPFNLYPGQGPQHVARPGTDLRRAFLAADSPARAVSAEQRARRTGRAGRIGRSVG